jgi:hypothetical protein
MNTEANKWLVSLQRRQYRLSNLNAIPKTMELAFSPPQDVDLILSGLLKYIILLHMPLINTSYLTKILKLFCFSVEDRRGS